MDVFKALYEFKQAQEIAEEIINVIDEIEPGKRAEIIRRLNKKRSKLSAIKFTQKTKTSEPCQE